MKPALESVSFTMQTREDSRNLFDHLHQKGWNVQAYNFCTIKILLSKTDAEEELNVLTSDVLEFVEIFS